MSKTKKITVLLGISGGIAAYKICDLARQLVRAGYCVKTVMTQSATEFVGPATFRSLTGNAVSTQLFEDPAAPINHISLAQAADIMLVAPATANVIAKLAHGVADDLLTTTALAFQDQLIVAPAMNTQMYLDPSTQENLNTLAARGVLIVGPASGQLACGDAGPGRMVEASQLFEEVEHCSHTSSLLTGKTVLINAGPTREFFDPVRYLSNRSSGKMGMALARAALRAGAKVILVLGPVSVCAPVDEQLMRIDVVSADDMHKAMLNHAPSADVIICTAAVADYRPVHYADKKMKKTRNDLKLDLVQNVDILAELGQIKEKGQLKKDLVLVGFAAETNDMDIQIREKFERKCADYLVANDVSRTDIGFESEENEIIVYGRTKNEDGSSNVGPLLHLPKASKVQLAARLIELFSG